MTAIFDNAKGLAEDARLLLDQGRISRAYALGVVAAEELGKILLVAKTAALLALSRPVDWTMFWRNFDDHSHKLFSFVSLSTLLEVKPEEWAAGDVQKIDEDADGALVHASQQASLMTAFRPRAMYVDVTDAGLSKPDAFIQREWAEMIVKGVETEIDRLPRIGLPPPPGSLKQWPTDPDQIARGHNLARQVNRIRPRRRGNPPKRP